MTNPFTVMVLHAIDSYNKVMANSPSQHTLHKGLFMFSLGTAIFATVMYKVTKTNTTPTPTPTTWSNFLSRFFNQYIIQSHVTTAGDDISFEDKYFKEYDEWIAAQDAAAEAHNKECLENMLYVRETINEFYGDIIMCYDQATSSFAYYARTANIPYKYLETVSRKYMIETNAPRDLHVDIRKEYAMAKDQLTNKKVSSSNANANLDNQTNNDTKQETDVFAKFKTYNTAPNISKTNQNQAQTPNQIPNQHNTKTTTSENINTSTKVIRENANRYSYRGKIADFEAQPTATTTTPAPQTATATATAAAAAATPVNETYAEYKKRGGAP